MKKILHVEDQEPIRRVLAVALTALGYDVTSAENGRAALQLLATEDYDIIITDHHMPEMTGLDVVRGLNANRLHPQIVVTSGCLDLGAEKEYLRLDHTISIVRKPYHLSDITLALSA
ncbi:MAG: hypothetical protein RIQ79_2205 [Verrucomicrobiota bacterium]